MSSSIYPQIFNDIVIKDKKIDHKIFEILKSINFEENEENALRLSGQRVLLEFGWKSPPKPTLTILSEVIDKLEKYKKLQFVIRTKQLMYKLSITELSENLSFNELCLLLTGR